MKLELFHVGYLIHMSGTHMKVPLGNLFCHSLLIINMKLLLLLLSFSFLCSSSQLCHPDEDLHNSCLDEDPTLCSSLAARGRCRGRAIINVTAIDAEWSALFSEAVNVNVRCPQSCKRYHRERVVQSRFAQAVSCTLEDHHVDIFGVRHDICDLCRGWTNNARKNLMMNSVFAYASFKSKELARYTEAGFRKDRLEPKVWEEVRRFYAGAVFTKEPLPLEGLSFWNSITVDSSESHVNLTDPPYSLYSNVDQPTQNSTVRSLLPLAEEWSGVKLEFSVLYGIRRYVRGGRFMAHVDIRSTHVISAIVNVGQDGMEEPWPLQILDHQGKVHSVVLEPGDLLWYESAKLPHGRVLPLQGNYYDNFFVHFRPASKKSSDL